MIIPGKCSFEELEIYCTIGDMNYIIFYVLQSGFFVIFQWQFGRTNSLRNLTSLSGNHIYYKNTIFSHTFWVLHAQRNSYLGSENSKILHSVQEFWSV